MPLPPFQHLSLPKLRVNASFGETPLAAKLAKGLKKRVQFDRLLGVEVAAVRTAGALRFV